MVTDPELYQPLMRGPNRLPKYTAPYRMFEVFTKPERSNILTSAEHATWKAVRQAAVAALTMNNLRSVRVAVLRSLQWPTISICYAKGLASYAKEQVSWLRFG